MDIQLEKKKGLRPKHYGFIALGLLVLFLVWKMNHIDKKIERIRLFLFTLFFIIIIIESTPKEPFLILGLFGVDL